MEKRSFTTQLITMALLMTLEIILTRFLSINLPTIRIGFGFLPIVVLAIMYGPLWAGAVYALGDIIGGILFPSGPFFPGFTLSALLTGLIYGLFLYKKEFSWKRVLIAVTIIILGINLVLDTTWLSILMGQGFIGMLPARLIKAAIMLPLDTILIIIVWRQLSKHKSLLLS